MMRDVDALSRTHEPLIASYIVLTQSLKNRDEIHRLNVYDSNCFDLLLSKGIYSLRDKHREISVDDCVKNLSRTLTNLNANKNESMTISCLLTATTAVSSKAKSYMTCDKSTSMYNEVKRRRRDNDDHTEKKNKFEANKICVMHTAITITNEYRKENNRVVCMMDKLQLYHMRPHETISYSKKSIMYDDGM